MKRTITALAALLLALALLASLAACGGSPAKDDIHLTPNSVTLLVTFPDGTQKTHNLSSGKSVLGDVLRDYGLVEFDDKGMIVKVDGVEASWDADQAYWAFYIDGEFATHGVDDEILTGMNEYEFRYTKG